MSLLRCYSTFLRCFPGVVITASLVLHFTFYMAALVLTDLPDFSNPIEGFATKNTEISRFAKSYRLFDGEFRSQNGRFLPFPLRADAVNYSSWTLAGTVEWTRRKRTSSLKYCALRPDSDVLDKIAFRVHHLDSLETFRMLCDVERLLALRGIFHRSQECAQRGNCCQPWHIASHAAHLLGFSSCRDVDEENFTPIQVFLRGCLSEGHKKQSSCSDLLTHFVAEGDEPITALLLPFSRKLSVDDVEHLRRRFGHALVGVDAGLKEKYFLALLKADVVFGVVAFCLVVLVLFVSSGSLFFTTSVVATIAQSLVAAYFFYRVVFKLNFFPFINLLTIVLLLGIGADDAFILRQYWRRERRGVNEAPMGKLVETCLSHSILSMGVTTETTVLVVLANLISHVTAIKCFAVFASMALCANYLLVISFLPACLIFQKKYSHVTSLCVPKKILFFAQVELSVVRERVASFAEVLEARLKATVAHFSAFFVFAFFIIAFGAIFCVVHSPGIRLPSDEYFKYFRESSFLERFDNSLSHKFSFMRTSRTARPIVLEFVWGLQPTGRSDPFDPNAPSESVMLLESRDSSLWEYDNLAWLKDFCSDLRNADFAMNSTLYDSRVSPCFVDIFLDFYMSRKCSNLTDICCEDTIAPFSRGVVDYCVSRMFSRLETPLAHLHTLQYPIGRPVFVRNFKHLSTTRYGIQLTAIPTKLNFSLDFNSMRFNYAKLKEFIAEHLKEAPAFFRTGFWRTEPFLFYDLHLSLLNDTAVSIAVGLVFAFFVLLFAVRNVVICGLAVFVIFTVIVTTLASLVLLGWELNVVESTIVLLAVGLSFDFVLHIAVAYRHSPEALRLPRTMTAISSTIAPVSLSMLTTAVTGAAMLPANTLAFFQIGLFMVLSSLISWISALFFFGSLLVMFGPEEGDCCIPRILSASRRTSVRQEACAFEKCSSTHVYCDDSVICQSSPHFPESFVPKARRGSAFAINGTIYKKREYGALSSGYGVRRASMPVVAIYDRRKGSGVSRVDIRSHRGMSVDVEATRILKREPLVSSRGSVARSVCSLKSHPEEPDDGDEL
ncbi:hypothetical protein QR680_005407 [Steinernema hermaphroditum]|uniref:SSD domain-containing protein n=1 Tax=Steinernema hermaphroditum TaxID=289476 RepID=A0AA39HU42_9BILA|nr:hypothetical protein QR680_005407 [Steinernema hermaphroditum]